MQSYDLIGDIHGHASKLHALLEKLGYCGEPYRHPEGRTVLFLGDYIDRGFENGEVLRVVRAMVEAGSALAILGNHEYNALCYHSYNWDSGQWLRRHNRAHTAQHSTVLAEFAGREVALREQLQWLMSLPLFLELPELRAIHACWHLPTMAQIEQLKVSGLLTADNRLTNAMLYESNKKGTAANDCIENLLKGPEAPLPDGVSFIDKGSVTRRRVRLRWWGEQATTLLGSVLSVPEEEHHKLEGHPAPSGGICYPAGEKPVFFGHYWMQREDDTVSANTACVDWSVAKGGHLAAYRFTPGEPLSRDGYLFV